MKKIYLLFAFALGTATLTKAQISLTPSNFPTIPSATYQYADSGTVPALNTTTGSLWDLGSVQKRGGRRQVTYTPVSNHPVFTAATERSEEWAYFGPLPVRQQIYLQKTNSGIDALGIGYEKQTISLGFITGLNTDSVTFPTQTYAFALPYTEISFPLQNTKSWIAQSKAHTTFNMNISLLGFNNTPCYFDNYFDASHEVISYGTCRVPSKGQPGTTYDALLLKSETLRVDSFYISGLPADPFLLAAMGVTQGDSVHTYQYRVFRENAGMQQLAIIEFEDDSYTTVKRAEYSAEFDMVSIGDIVIDNGLMVYPNPVVGNTVYVQVPDGFGDASFTITDINGRTIPAQAQNTGAGYTLTTNNPLATGVYQLTAQGTTNTTTIKLVVK